MKGTRARSTQPNLENKDCGRGVSGLGMRVVCLLHFNCVSFLFSFITASIEWMNEWMKAKKRREHVLQRERVTKRVLQSHTHSLHCNPHFVKQTNKQKSKRATETVWFGDAWARLTCCTMPFILFYFILLIFASLHSWVSSLVTCIVLNKWNIFSNPLFFSFLFNKQN